MSKTILILAANPKDTPQLRLDQEVREIENGLERAQKREEFTVKQRWAARPVDVRRAMLDFNPNIVHFCGHGAGEEGIAFEDEMGQTKFVNADALAGFFQLFADKVECVVLNACYSEVQAKAITKHIPYVIGMSKAIPDISAIEFSVAFYDALGAGKTFEFAYKLACNAIQWENEAENLTPKLETQRQYVEKKEELEHEVLEETELISQQKNPAIIIYFLAAKIDEKFCKAVQRFLKPTFNISPRRIELYSDFSIPDGEDETNYRQKLFEADIVLAFASQSFIDDDEIQKRNQTVLIRFNKGETKLLGIFVRNFILEDSIFTKFPLLPKNGFPLNNKNKWPDDDETYTEIAKDIRETILTFFK